MRELLGIPEWLAVTLFLAVVLATGTVWAFHSIRTSHRRLAEKRPNPTRDEFLTMLRGDVDEDVAVWMWDQLLYYYRPLTPHRGDLLIDEARIDDDDIDMDWVPQFAKAMGLDHQTWPDWPAGWELTVRNFARFLQLGRDRQADVAASA